MGAAYGAFSAQETMRRAVVIVAAVCIVGGLWFAWMLQAPEQPGHTVMLEIPGGTSAKEVAALLREKKLIRSMLAFEVYVRLRGVGGSMQAGNYELSTGYSTPRTVDALLFPGERAVSKITLIEGWSLREYRERLVASGFDGAKFDAQTASVSSWQQDYAFFADVSLKRSLEGYLFPDTYATTNDRSVTDLIDKMLANFQLKISPLQDAIESRGRSLHDSVILASIIEREVIDFSDRKLVADIFWRREANGIALQSDATINYITQSGRARSTAKDLQIDSPYNTYKYRGLPPGPIGNPGLEALTAAVHPTPNEFWYFLTDEAGSVHYAKSFVEHQRNVEKFLK